MKYFEFGKENTELMVMLHGGLAGEQQDDRRVLRTEGINFHLPTPFRNQACVPWFSSVFQSSHDRFRPHFSKISTIFAKSSFASLKIGSIQ